MKEKRKNPYPYSDTNKRYYTFDYYTKQKYGKKCAKLPLDIGCSCPNIDGSKGEGGCIYCSSKGSGDFTSRGSVTKQLEDAEAMIRKKWSDVLFIPYFQAHTNTYAPIPYLREKYFEAAGYKDAVEISIATRADTISDGVVSLLAEVAEKIPVTVELGLQSESDETARLINRCMTTEEFLKGYEKLGGIPGVRRCVHMINGLPGEDLLQMEKTARFVASLLPDEVKIHMLYILKGTKAGRMYEAGETVPLTRDEFVDITVRQLTLLPPKTVIGRLTGDAPGELLLAPEWTRKKVCVINEIDKKMSGLDLWQGKEYK